MNVFLIASLIAASLAATCHAQTAEEMVSSCKEISNAKVANHQVELPSDFDSGVCWGAFGTVQEMTRLAEKDGKLVFNICAPPESTRTQLVQIFEQYATRHPERFHEHFWFIAEASLREAFPCKPGIVP